MAWIKIDEDEGQFTVIVSDNLRLHAMVGMLELARLQALRDWNKDLPETKKPEADYSDEKVSFCEPNNLTGG